MATPFSRKTTSTKNAIAVTIKPFTVRIAKCQAASDPTQPPTWGDFMTSKVVEVVSCEFGSSLGGMSTAKIRIVPGLPVTRADETVEQVDPLSHGDRVIISIGSEPRWAGYCVGGAINIDPEAETLTYELMGPEWIWGDNGREGSQSPVYGQIRRVAQADDEAFTSDDQTTADQLTLVSDEMAVFNPHGRKTMTLDAVQLSTGSEPVTGRCWEIPDRKNDGDDYSVAWKSYEAAKTLLTWFNDPVLTGIQPPDWTKVKIDNSNAIPETNVDGMGLWGALRAVLAPDWHFFVDPVPSDVDQWDGFQMGFFQRGQGPTAKFFLNEPKTLMASAKASVTRLNAAKLTTTSVNRVSVLGKAVRHIQLRYWGGVTQNQLGIAAALTLQHGWGGDEDKLSNYSVNVTLGGTPTAVVDISTIQSKTTTVTQQWLDRYIVGGKFHTQYKHVFRLFIWNEAGEWQPESDPGAPLYGNEENELDFYIPDLTGVADATGFSDRPGQYARRRRRLLDTSYPDSTSDSDGWRRVPPTLYVASRGVLSATQTDWARISPGDYHVDHERGAVWITVPDIGTWTPLKDVPHPDEPSTNDLRTFATLLRSGCLRMLLEASIDCDSALTALADRQLSAGSPLIRQRTDRANGVYVQSLALKSNIDSPSGISPAPVDDSANALDYAERLRTTLERQQAHASVTTCADWPEQTIGTIVTGTDGRQINLQAGANNTGPGAQIVRKVISVKGMCWEYLTESRVLERIKRPKHPAHSTPTSAMNSGAHFNVAAAAGAIIEGAI